MSEATQTYGIYIQIIEDTVAKAEKLAYALDRQIHDATRGKRAINRCPYDIERDIQEVWHNIRYARSLIFCVMNDEKYESAKNAFNDRIIKVEESIISSEHFIPYIL